MPKQVPVNPRLPESPGAWGAEVRVGGVARCSNRSRLLGLAAPVRAQQGQRRELGGRGVQGWGAGAAPLSAASTASCGLGGRVG